jgi:hypothetical protein
MRLCTDVNNGLILDSDATCAHLRGRAVLFIDDVTLHHDQVALPNAL